MGSITKPFLSDPGIPGVRSIDPSLSHSLTFCKLYKLYKFYKLYKLYTLYREGDSFYTGRFKLVEPTNASSAIRWPNLQQMQVAPSGGQICRSVVPLAMFLCWKLHLTKSDFWFHQQTCSLLKCGWVLKRSHKHYISTQPLSQGLWASCQWLLMEGILNCQISKLVRESKPEVGKDQ